MVVAMILNSYKHRESTFIQTLKVFRIKAIRAYKNCTLTVVCPTRNLKEVASAQKLKLKIAL
jgi:hypothetical protein